MTGRLAIPLVAAAMILAGQARAAVPDWASLEPVSEATLAQQRGGFAWAGMQINFGADMRTYLGDELVLHTILSWTDSGAEISRTVSGTLTPASAAELEAGLIGAGAIRMRVGDSSVYLANEGRTAILHRTDGGIQNVLINTAPDVTARQEVDATLSISNYAAFRAEAIEAAIGTRLRDMVDGAALAGLGR